MARSCVDDREADARRAATRPRRLPGHASTHLRNLLLTIFLLFLACLLAGTAAYYRIQSDQLLDDQRVALEEVADLKVRQIEQWMAERRADAEVLRENGAILPSLQQLASGEPNLRAREDVQAWLAPMQRSYGYLGIVVLSSDNRALAWVPEGVPMNLGPEDLQDAREVRGNPDLVRIGLHVQEPAESVVIDIAIALRAGGGKRPEDPFVAVFRMDADKALIHYVQDWPAQSPSAEALLVQQDGDEVVYLTGTRLGRHRPLALRVPIGSPSLPAARALRGDHGVFEGIDYRGVEVLFATRKVSGTGWALVAKKDSLEVQAPLRFRMAWALFALVLTSLAAALGLRLVWRGAEAELVRERLATAADRAELSKLYQTLGDVNAAVIRTRDRRVLLDRVCEIAVQMGGFRLAWVGWPDAETNRIVSLARHGEAAGFLDDARMSNLDQPEGRGPTGTALREGRIVVCEDVQSDPRMQPWRVQMMAYGLGSAAAFPLTVRGAVVGVFSLYAVETSAFAPRRLDLLERLAADVSYALEFLEEADLREEAEEAIRRLNVELEERVRRRTAQVDAVNRELESFAYSVSHDLRAPLRAMDGFAQALIEDCSDQVPPQGQVYLQRIQAASQRMGHLIDDLLRLSRVTRAEMRNERVDLSALVNRIVAELRAVEPDRQVLVTVQPGLEAVGDANLLWIALDNLLGNAWKFTQRRLVAHIDVGARVRGGVHEFYVTDDGEGFDPNLAGQLFAPFQRLHSASEFPGTGIGLATVQRVVARHGGHVGAVAMPGEGATFWFTLGETATEGDAHETDPAGRRQPG